MSTSCYSKGCLTDCKLSENYNKYTSFIFENSIFAQNIILCRNQNGKIIICSQPLEGKIDSKSIVDYIAEITDGGKSSITKRVKKYNLKSFKVEE